MTMAAIPYCLLGLILLFVFAFELRWFPGHGGYRIGHIPNLSWKFLLEAGEHAVLPALSILLSSLGFWAVAMRGMMVTVEGEDYITLAEAKGIKSGRLFFDYGLRNAILSKFQDSAIDYLRVVQALYEAGYTGYICVGYVWTEWEGCNEVDNLSETVQMRDLLRSVDLS